jgi:hypothetical protein
MATDRSAAWIKGYLYGDGEAEHRPGACPQSDLGEGRVSAGRA